MVGGERGGSDVLHPESKQQTTPAAPRDALECVAALALTREVRQNCVRFAYLGPQVDRLHACSSSSATWNDVRFELKHQARMGAT